MKILITGSAGFVGHHIVEHFLDNTDCEIVGIDSFRHRGDSLRIGHDKTRFDTKRYKVLTHDLKAPISDRMIDVIGDVDYILNVASESHVDRSIDDPVGFVENNVSLVLNMLELAREVKPKMFFQISTDEVYGPALEGTLHKEWSPILPSNPYAASKAAQEAIAISYWRTYAVPLIITNTMNMIGERQDKEKYIPSTISKIRKGQMVTVHGNSEYIGKRFYLHARNFADALLFLIKRNKVTMYEDRIDTLIVPDRFNIVGDVEKNNLEIAQMIASFLKTTLHFQLKDFHSARPGHDRRYALDGQKIANLGWKAPVSFEQALEKTITWTLNHKEWL